MRFDHSDEELVALFVQTRKNVYFDVLYRRYFTRVCRHCCQFTGDDDEAKDLAQELFIRLIDRLDSFRSTARFSTWIGAVTRNFCIDYHRRQQTLPLVILSQQPNMPDPGDWAALNDEDQLRDTERLTIALGYLSPAETQLLMARYWDKTSINDLARRQELTDSAVKMQLFRARARLKTAYLSLPD